MIPPPSEQPPSPPEPPSTPPVAPGLSFEAGASTIAFGEGATLTWAASNATTCAASGGWTGAQPTSGTTQTQSLTQNTTFGLTCSGPGGDAHASVTIGVSAPPSPSVELTLQRLAVKPGETNELTWHSQNADECVASGGWSGERPTEGREVTSVLNQDTPFRLHCTGPGGVAVSEVMGLVALGPRISLSASQAAVTKGASFYLQWWVDGEVDRCEAFGGWSGEKPRWRDAGGLRTMATEEIRNLPQTTAFGLSCSGPSGTATEQVTVAVSAFCEAPLYSFSAIETRVPANQPVKLEWATSGFSSCTASGGWSGDVGGRERFFEVTPKSSAEGYTLQCTSLTSQFAKTIGIGVDRDPPPTVELWASHTMLSAPQTVSFNWTVSNVRNLADCQLSGDLEGNLGSSSVPWFGSSGQIDRSVSSAGKYMLTCSGPGGASSAEVAITMIGNNVPPTAGDPVRFELYEDTSTDFPPDSLIAGASDPDGCVAGVALHAQSLTAFSPTDPYRLFTEDTRWSALAGNDFEGSGIGGEIGAVDNAGAYSPQKPIEYEIHGVDDKPLANDDIRMTEAAQSIFITVTDNDRHLDRPLRIELVAPPANGQAAIVEPERAAHPPFSVWPDQYVWYRPNDGFSGRDTLRYRLTDRDGDTAEANVSIDVGAEACAPNGSYGAPVVGVPNRDWYIVGLPDVDPSAGVADYRGRIGFAGNGLTALRLGVTSVDQMHEGVDVLASHCGRILEVQDRGELDFATVKGALQPEEVECGNYVMIEQPSGRLDIYCGLLHQSAEHLFRLPKLRKLEVGDWIAKGQKIGRVGRSGSNVYPQLIMFTRSPTEEPLDIVGQGLAEFEDPSPQRPTLLAIGTTDGADTGAPGIRRAHYRNTFSVGEAIVPWISILSVPPRHSMRIWSSTAQACLTQFATETAWRPRADYKARCEGVPVGDHVIWFMLTNVDTNEVALQLPVPARVVETPSNVPPSVELFSSPSAVEPGGSATLTWQTSGVQRCRLSGGSSASVGAFGSLIVSELRESQRYSIVCDSAAGPVIASTTVNVYDPPKVELVSDRTTVAAGATATLAYRYGSATECEIPGVSDDFSEAARRDFAEGAIRTPVITSDRTFHLVCRSPAGVTVSMVTVAVDDSGGNQPPVAVPDEVRLANDIGFARLPFAALMENDSDPEGELGPDAYLEWEPVGDWSDVEYQVTPNAAGELGIDLFATPNSDFELSLRYSIEDALGQRSSLANSTVRLLSSGRLVEGPDDALAIDMFERYIGEHGVPEAVFFEYEGVEVARTRISLEISPSTTVGQLNGYLAAVSGKIAAMLPGHTLVVVDFPDPGTESAFDSLVAATRALPWIEYVGMEYRVEPALAPSTLEIPSVPAQHLAIGAGGLWNTRRILAEQKAADVPWLLMIDYFGNRLPSSAVFNVWGENADFYGGPSNAEETHGYHVLGLLTSADEVKGNAGPGIFRAWSDPSLSPPAVELRALNLSKSIEASLRAQVPTHTPQLFWLADTIDSLRNEVPGRNFVVNLSLQTPDICEVGLSDEDVRRAQNDAAILLADDVLLVVAAGNQGKQDATTCNYLARVARYLPGGLIVENRAAADIDFGTGASFNPICLNNTSNRSGDVSAIGSAYGFFAWGAHNLEPFADPFPDYKYGTFPDYAIRSFGSTSGSPLWASGTSMAAPQVAGLALHLWTAKPQLTAKELKQLIVDSAQEPHYWDTMPPPFPPLEAAGWPIPFCATDAETGDLLPGEPVIDALRAVLKLDDVGLFGDEPLEPEAAFKKAPIRAAIVDVTSDSVFNDADVQLIASNWVANRFASYTATYSRYDFNGDGFDLGIDGGIGLDQGIVPPESVRPIDLNNDGKTETVIVKVGDFAPIVFDEKRVTDHNFLCYLVLSPLYSTLEDSNRRGDPARVNAILRNNGLLPCYSDRILGARIRLNESHPDWLGMPGQIVLSQTRGPIDWYVGSNDCGSAWGGPLFQYSVDLPAAFYEIQHTEGVPYNESQPPNRDPCSSFIAVRDLTVVHDGIPQARVWMNATAMSQVTGLFGTLTKEYQVRIYSGDPGNREATKYAILGQSLNNRNFDEILRLTDFSFELILEESGQEP